MFRFFRELRCRAAVAVGKSCSAFSSRSAWRWSGRHGPLPTSKVYINLKRGPSMPLRDHFRPPVNQHHAWDELHGGWPMMMVQRLSGVLPGDYRAAPRVPLGPAFVIDEAANLP